jgi:hypothetical protein
MAATALTEAVASYVFSSHLREDLRPDGWA